MPKSPTTPGTPRLSDLARHVVVPKGITATAWPPVVAKCAELGIGFDPWQHGAGRVILAKRGDGKYAASVGGVVLSIPRQVGKTYMIGAIVFALCLLSPNMTVIWTAHRLRTANETFRAMRGMAKRKKVAPFVEKIVLGSGDEEIQFRNGSRILFGARERGFGVGFAEVDVLVVDEAQRATTAALDDMVPTTNQSKQPAGPLLFFMGTPPRPTDSGEVFRQKRKEALSGEDDDTAYIEFSADRDADPDDWLQVAKANPSHPLRTPREAILRMRKNLTEDSFLREGLGIWDELEEVERVIPSDIWNALAADSDAPAQNVPPSAVGVDMSHDRVLAISGCWLNAPAAHVEVLALTVASDADAVEWLVERCGRRIPVVIDSLSPAASLIPTLKGRRVRVIVTSATDMSKACGGLFSDAIGGHLTHADQDQLTNALAGATKRKIGDAGGWGWDRKDPTVNIAPLVSVTLARFGAVVTAKPKSSNQGEGRRAVVL